MAKSFDRSEWTYARSKNLMGHKTIQMTMRCAHLAALHQLEAVQRLCDTGFAQSGARLRTGLIEGQGLKAAQLMLCKQWLRLPSRDGGTGRRSGLKIRRKQFHGGSIPPPGTI
jgi:hypothetical protein